MLKFHEFEVYHSDIKNANVVVVFDYLNRLVAKIIDLGVASMNFAVIEGYTP